MVMNDVSFDPDDIRLLGAQAVVLQPQPIPEKTEQPWRSRTEKPDGLFQVIGQNALSI
ncbi:hypothetical protein [Aromatoleum buckelii]|uniref:hypothetical protein n=1 Tax=Aromatoleum buckelii TaxID=200254 RepID=UPI001FF475D3|nr:hypothetical protein [Aromatoleum buckelii]MCK0512801.1 hypothetical protein [Aromatoleum buckelii]